MARLLSNIEKLRDICIVGDTRINFNSHIELEEIETLEKAYGLIFPDSYKQFLENFNGGMILEHDIHFYTDMTDWEPDGPKHSSFYFFTLDEICEKYTEAKNDDWLLDEGFMGIYPIIPICSTPQQDLLFIVSQKGISNESPVYVANEKSASYACTEVASNFDSFLGDYIKSAGFPNLKNKDDKSSFKSYFTKNNVLEIANKDETNEEIIERNTAYIRLYPESSWSYNERGVAYRNSGRKNLALDDFNSSIKINNKKAFFYYCRGALILDYGSARKALIDMDIAVKLEPGNKLFLTGRADALQKLGKLDKALLDCNDILKNDSTYILALYVRERVFKAMGNTELAQLDSDLIDELD